MRKANPYNTFATQYWTPNKENLTLRYGTLQSAYAEWKINPSRFGNGSTTNDSAHEQDDVVPLQIQCNLNAKGQCTRKGTMAAETCSYDFNAGGCRNKKTTTVHFKEVPNMSKSTFAAVSSESQHIECKLNDQDQCSRNGTKHSSTCNYDSKKGGCRNKRRPSPSEHAGDFKGQTKKGNDQNEYKSTERKNGAWYWKRTNL